MDAFSISAKLRPVCGCLTAARVPSTDGTAARNGILLLLRRWLRDYGPARTAILAQAAIGCCVGQRR